MPFQIRIANKNRNKNKGPNPELETTLIIPAKFPFGGPAPQDNHATLVFQSLKIIQSPCNTSLFGANYCESEYQ